MAMEITDLDVDKSDLYREEFEASGGGSNENISAVGRSGEVVDDWNGDLYASSDSGDSVTNYRRSPGGRKYYVPDCDEKLKPNVNQLFESLESAVEFYQNYGRVCGFDIRRGTEKSCDGIITLKHLLCNRAGYKEKKLDSSVSVIKSLKRKRRNKITRSGCNAKIVLSFTSDGYRVRSFKEEHSHALVESVCRQFLKSSCKMSVMQKSFVVSSSKVGMGATKSHSLMKEMVGGYSRIGSTSTDFKIFNRDLKLYIGHSDAQMIVDKFTDKQKTCQGFCFEYGVDDNNCLSKLFWVDPIGRRNYNLFGDGVSFDATFRTNMYKMVFVPFIGVDNHKKCVTFGAGLLSKEDVAHYTWLLEAFVRAMGRKPLMVITDQCPSMKQAVPDVFGDKTRHRLCMWHIMRKFPEKVKICTSDDCDFMKSIGKVIWNEDEGADVFERDWKKVITKFKVEDNSWLSNLYDNRRSWIPAYFRDEPMVGLLRTTSRSESENFFFSHFVRKGDTLCQFYMRFESAMDKQRHKNLTLNYESAVGWPSTDSTLPLENDAANVYTRSVFYDFQEELKASFVEVKIQSCVESDGIKIFVLKEKRKNDKLFEVRHSLSDNYVVCSCKMLERIGLLCRHAIFALNQGDVTKTPRSLVRTLWTKNVEKRNGCIPDANVCEESSKMEKWESKLNDVWFDVQACFNLVGSDADELDFLQSEVKLLHKKLQDRVGKNVKQDKKKILESFVGSSLPSEVSIQVPNQSRNKGCGKRIQSGVEKSIKEQQKATRECRLCNLSDGHDKRNCPSKKNLSIVNNETVE